MHRMHIRDDVMCMMTSTVAVSREQRAAPGAELRPQGGRVEHQLRQRSQQLRVVTRRYEDRLDTPAGTSAGRQHQRAGTARP